MACILPDGLFGSQLHVVMLYRAVPVLMLSHVHFVVVLMLSTLPCVCMRVCVCVFLSFVLASVDWIIIRGIPL